MGILSTAFDHVVLGKYWQIWSERANFVKEPSFLFLIYLYARIYAIIYIKGDGCFISPIISKREEKNHTHTHTRRSDMRTRRGLCHPRVMNRCVENSSGRVAKRRKLDLGDYRKILKTSPEATGGYDFFDALPDDLVLSVLGKLSSTAACPADFVNVLTTYVFLFFIFAFLLLE